MLGFSVEFNIGQLFYTRYDSKHHQQRGKRETLQFVEKCFIQIFCLIDFLLATAVWIRVNRFGIQISAQDPQIARIRIPVFIPLSLIHDIFLHPTITNIICIVYDEVKSNMKGVLLYVVHPTDALLFREDFRLLKQSFYSKGVSNGTLSDAVKSENNPLIYGNHQKSIGESHRNGRTSKTTSPRRVLYIRDSETGTNREISNFQQALSSTKNRAIREGSSRRRERSPKKSRTEQSTSKPNSDDERKIRRKSSSVSSNMEKHRRTPTPETTEKITQITTTQIDQQNEQNSVWQNVQVIPIIPMGIYNR